VKTTWKYGTGSRSAIGDPLGARPALALRAVSVATAVIGDANEAAVLALLDMAAVRGGAADFDGGHDAALVRLIFDYAAGDYRPNRGPT